MAAQKYGPPLVGCALQTSVGAVSVRSRNTDSDVRTGHRETDHHSEKCYRARVKIRQARTERRGVQTTTHPQTMTPGPPVLCRAR